MTITTNFAPQYGEKGEHEHFLNARAALEMASTVADLMAPELGWDELTKGRQLVNFPTIAANYVLPR